MGKAKRIKETKAAKLLAIDAIIKPGEGIIWPVYNGKDILESEAVHNYCKAFLMSGEKMPIPGYDLKLDVVSVEATYDNVTDTHKVIVEGIIEKRRKKKS